MTKLHRLIFLINIYFLTLFMFTSQVYALFESNVDKAKEFMQAGMYPQAITLLEKETNDNPTNAEAHFQLGICYVNQNNFSNADERFSSAVCLKPDYGYQIGEEYKKAGKESISKGNNSSAKSLFSKAVDYQPNLKKEIAPLYFDIGKTYLNQSQSNMADEFLLLARNFDPSLNNDIKATTQTYGKKLLDIAKDKPKEERRKYVDEARKYVGQETIDKVFPPPSWKTILTQKYTGKGYGKNDHVNTVRLGIDVKLGDKIIIMGEKFDVWHSRKWQSYTDKHEAINKNPRKLEKGVAVRTAKGNKFTVEVQRFTSDY
jgi:tetratricopeptide (TPR) repeat protein